MCEHHHLLHHSCICCDCSSSFWNWDTRNVQRRNWGKYFYYEHHNQTIRKQFSDYSHWFAPRQDLQGLVQDAVQFSHFTGKLFGTFSVLYYFQASHSYGAWGFLESLICMYTCLNLMRRPNSDWFWQVTWHKYYWWHHSTLSTRPNDSTLLVTSVKVSFRRPRTEQVLVL